MRQYIFRFKLKEVLEQKRITQKELAEMTGIREATISDMSNDTRSVYNKKHIAKIMDVLDLTELDEILELIVIDK